MKKIIFLICYLLSPILVFSQNSGGMIRRPKQKSSKTIVINKPKIIRVEVAKKIVRNINISDAVFFVEAKDKNGIVYNRLTRQSPWQGLTKHQRYPIEKERNVPYPTQLASKSLQLGIERFCRCVGSA